MCLLSLLPTLFYGLPIAKQVPINDRSVSRKPCLAPHNRGIYVRRGSSDTNQEINLNYRDAPPCRRGAALNFFRPALCSMHSAILSSIYSYAPEAALFAAFK